MSFQVVSILCIHLEIKWAAVWPRLRQRKGGLSVEGGHQSLRFITAPCFARWNSDLCRVYAWFFALSPFRSFYSGLQDAVLNVFKSKQSMHKFQVHLDRSRSHAGLSNLKRMFLKKPKNFPCLHLCSITVLFWDHPATHILVWIGHYV